MATTTSRKKKIDDMSILSLYIDQFLENDGSVENVYKFCKHNKIEESQLYMFFSSLEQIKTFFWEKIFENTLNTIEKSEGYFEMSKQEKLLTFYFTCFENLTLNRNFVRAILPQDIRDIKSLKVLSSFREHFLDFIDTNMSIQQTETDKTINKITKPITMQSYWLQFLFILKFWLDDTSKGFEKTDIMIEKTVKAGTEIFDLTPFEGLIDFGKFLWKEKFSNKSFA